MAFLRFDYYYYIVHDGWCYYKSGHTTAGGVVVVADDVGMIEPSRVLPSTARPNLYKPTKSLDEQVMINYLHVTWYR
jgi:hypothetical protein